MIETPARLAHRIGIALALGALAACSAGPPESGAYHPPQGEWARRAPAALGMDSARLAVAVAYALAHETERPPRDFGDHEELFGPLQGPLPESRGGPAGLIVRDGYIVAEWGDVERVDLAFSATKSFVSTAVGLAVDEGLIRDVHDPVGEYVRDGRFDSPHNATITWDMLLRQTSEWEGTLFGKADTADFYHRRDRTVGRQEPGTYWEYNDVRVNLASYSALRVWERGLPEVLKERVMDPIGASDSWEWHGYRSSDVVIDGRTINSVSGGGHWGGGMWISALDMARFGLLFLRDGVWDGRRLISERWIDMATTPTDIQPAYGYMWWLSADSTHDPSRPVETFAARGYGGNSIWIDRERDLVVVTRWFGGDWRELERMILDALAAPSPAAAAS